MSSAVITCADTSVLSNMMTHEALPGRKPKHPHPAVAQRCSSWYRFYQTMETRDRPRLILGKVAGGVIRRGVGNGEVMSVFGGEVWW